MEKLIEKFKQAILSGLGVTKSNGVMSQEHSSKVNRFIKREKFL